ncbi:type II secretion system F family protein [Magnetospira sp. QH-2]|uniref:type II secretion system F family protein n=1 Tax=Magnetospira sp. (strain QH-2) TaxID=1288970 RepID=UPI0003E80B5B|nr:type II secretion system F family protein [Magnetospira sp. QH-2]CCQ73555.1 Putative Flp pilus assembly protein TadC [Magnetospira sp. QH-2]
MNELNALLPIPAEDLITLLAATAAFIAVIAVWNSLRIASPLNARVKALKTQREALKAGVMMRRGRKERQSRRENAVGLMRGVVEKLKLLGTQEANKAARKLAAAGWRSKDSLVIYMFFKLALPFGAGAMAAFFLYGLGLWDMPSLAKLFVALLVTVIGAYAPEVYVRNASDRRRKALRKGLPDGLDLLVICTEAGLSLDAALTRVSRELTQAAPELSDELSLTALELGFLPERRLALENLEQRTDSEQIRAVVNTLLQTEKYGTPLSQSLRVLASEFRDERMLKAEEKAAKLPATLTVPLIVFILPTLFIVLLGPAIMNTIDGLSSLGG